MREYSKRSEVIRRINADEIKVTDEECYAAIDER